MSVTIANVANTDVVDFTIEQTGSSKTEIYMEEPLLDGTKDYVVGVSELSVSLSEEPMITYSLQDSEFFTIHRRKTGNNITTLTANADGIIIPANIGPLCQIQADYKIFTPADFVTFIAQFAAGFSRRYYDNGIGGVHHTDDVAPNDDALRPSHGNSLLAISLSPSGVLQFRGTALFWRNFFIVPGAYAAEICGFSESIICLTYVDPEYAKDSALLANAGNIIQDSAIGDVPPLTYAGEHSIFRFLDERMYITLEAGDLSLPFNQLIRDGVETKTHELVSVPFETKYKTTIKTSNGIVQASIDLEMDTFLSRTHFIRKGGSSVSWYPLSSSYFVQNMRLELYITRRRFSEGSWIYTKYPVEIDEDGLWNATLKFCSIH